MNDHALLNAACRESLHCFAMKAFGIVEPGTKYEDNWHVSVICKFLEAAYRGEIKRLLINLPPRTLKSYLVARAFPAWVMGKEPATKFISTSYGHEVSEQNALACRRIMKDPWYMQCFPRTRIGEMDRNTHFETTQFGQYYAASALSPLTGLGCDFFLADDLLKPMEAASETIRNSTNENMRNTFFSRFNDKRTGRFIMVMQRLHENDPTGNLLKDGGWVHLKLPAEAMEDIVIELNGETWTMKKGDLLFPARLSKEILAQTRLDMTEATYVGQYLQDPVPMGGGEFKEDWLQLYAQGSIKPKEMNIVILVDPAGGEELNKKKKKTGDWSVFQVWGLAADNNYYLLDMIRDRLNPTDRVETLFMLVRKWNDLSRKSCKVGYEQYGMQTDVHYIKEKQKQDAYHFNIIPLGGRMQKEERIRQLIPPMQQSRIYIPGTLPYVDVEGRKFDLVVELKGEMATFPRSRFDDICFVAGTMIATKNGPRPIEEIAVGDEVLTPDGWKKTYGAGESGRYAVIENCGLMGTPGHPIYTIDSGYIPLDTVSRTNNLVRNSLCSWIKIALLKSLGSMESNTNLWAPASTILSGAKQEKMSKVYMSLYGNFIRERQFLRATKLTILIVTHLITCLRIYAAYRVRSIAAILHKNIGNICGSTWKKSGRWPVSGTVLKPEENGIARIARSILIRFSCRMNASVKNAVPLSLLDTQACARRGSAPIVAETEIEHLSDTLSQNMNTSASSAASYLGDGETREHIAANHAQVEHVFNLSVEGANCYFANGILVHNCDTASRLFTPELHLAFPQLKSSMVAKALRKAHASGQSESWMDY